MPTSSTTRDTKPACRRAIVPAAVFAAFVLAGCAAAPDEYVERPVEELYNEAMDALEAGEFATAAAGFDEVERQHPYSLWATRAQLMSAYAYYSVGSYDEAVLAAERYLQLHPGSPEAPYAHYLAAISFYEQIADVRRDQGLTRAALIGLEQVVLRYPETEYARDARLKVGLAYEHLAGKEMEVGRFYLKRGQYVAAINRFRNVIERYETTSHTPEALHRLTEAYLALGVVPEAQAAAAVLGYNFPGSDWYQDSYRLLADAGVTPAAVEGEPPADREPGWLSRMLGFFRRG